MKLLPLLLALLASGARAQQAGPPQTLLLQQHNGGVATFYSGNRIGPNQSPYILNGYLDADAAVVKRNGYQPYGAVAGCTSPMSGGWSYTNLNGTFYSFVVCGNQMYKTTGDGNYTAVGSTLSTSYPVRGTTMSGLQWFTNGTDQLWSTDGVVVSSYSSAPFAKLIGTYQNRLVLSGITGGIAGMGFTAAQSGTWLSGYNNATDFSLPAVIIDTSAAFFPLNGSNDTRTVTCMFDGFKNVLILWNNGQTWGLTGVGNGSFNPQLISNEIGCTDPGSVQEYNGKLNWLSKRGIEGYDGTTIALESWPIQDQVQNLITLQANNLLNQQSSQSDWQAGNLSASGPGAKLSATLYPGDVVPSSFSYTDTPSTFGNGSQTQLSTSTNVGYISLSTTGVVGSTTIVNNYESGTLGGSSCSTTGGACSVSSVSPVEGVYSADIESGGVCDAGTSGCSMNIFTISGSTVLFSPTFGSWSSGNVSTTTIGTGNYYGQQLNIHVRVSCNVSGSATFSDYYSGYFVAKSSLTYMDKSATADCGNRVGIGYKIDNIQVIQSPSVVYFTSGSYVSPVFDTGFSTPVAGPFVTSSSIPANTSITFQMRQAKSLAGPFSAWVDVTTGTTPNLTQEFWQYKSSFTTSVTTVTPQLQAATLLAETSGYYISQCIQPTGIASWGSLQANTVPNGGSFTFWMSTATTCAAATDPRATNWTQQSLNATISVATAPAVGVRVLFGLDVATEVPRLQDITVNWSGAGRPALASVVYNKRYYIAYTSNTSAGAYNDHMLVHDTNGNWSLLDDIFASSLYVSNLKLYSGSSKSDGKVFLQDVGSVDNGVPFQFRLDTPDLDLGNFAALKDLNDWWVEAQGTTVQTQAANVAVNYTVDGGSTPYSAGAFSTFLPERNYVFANGNFGLGGSPTKVHTLRLQYVDTSASPLRIYQTALRYWMESLP
jgi:hypothetical protein